MTKTKIPLYFNYIENTFPRLLEDAVASIKHDRIEVHVVRHAKPKPFTQCLNDIQKECLERGDRCWMFMHCDAEVLDNSIIDMIIERYESPVNGEKIASVCACAITDLLILYDTQTIRKLDGWDDKNFNNSYMEIDLHNRIVASGFTQPILYNVDCPKQMSHKESSSLRNKTKQGSLFKVYSKTYENDMRNFFRIYHSNSNVDNNAGLIRWKKYVGDTNSDEFQKRDLNLVFSIGKTASTSIFRSWACDVVNLPVAHSHCLQWFSVVDFEDSIFVQNVRTNMKGIIYDVTKPSYVPDGCVQIRINLKESVKFGAVFSNLLFDKVNVVSIIRDPVHRRVSQFLNTLTCDSFNLTSAILSDGESASRIDPASDILPQLKTFRPLFQKPAACVISRILTNVAGRDNRLCTEEDLVPLFKGMFIGMDHREYNWMFNVIRSQFGVSFSPEEISERGYATHHGRMDYSGVDASLKDSDGMDINCIAFKMDKMYDPNVSRVVKVFTGIKTISHDRNISEEDTPVVDADLNVLKDKIRSLFVTRDLYKDEKSPELKIVTRLGY